MKRSFLVLILPLALACRTMGPGPSATARLEPRSGSTASGTVTFTEAEGDWVRVTVELDRVPPGVHGFHVHEKGDCSAPDATSAGGHFNPTGAPHGPHGTGSHAGDLPNVTADDNGRVRTEFMTQSLTVTQGDRSVVGRAVVLHTNADDLKTQPTGNAGGRIACGVVRSAAP